MDSILASTKILSGVMEEYENFNADLVMYINSVFLTLHQLGVGPAEGFMIEDDSTTWEEFIPNNRLLRNAVKTYMGHKVRLQFDPPTNSALLGALERTIAEYEWRINIAAETTPSTNEPVTPAPTPSAAAILGRALLGSMKLGYAGG